MNACLCNTMKFTITGWIDFFCPPAQVPAFNKLPRHIDPAVLAGRSAREVMDAIVEVVRPADGTFQGFISCVSEIAQIPV